MAMAQTSAARFLTGRKVRFHQNERANHTHFELVLDLGKVPLPAVVCLSRSPGDISKSNLKGLAESLGMNIEGLLRAEACHIGFECIRLCIVSRLLREVLVQQHNCKSDPIVFGRVIQRLCESANAILDELGEHQLTDLHWSSAEKDALAMIEGRCLPGITHVAAISVVERIRKWIDYGRQ